MIKSEHLERLYTRRTNLEAVEDVYPVLSENARSVVDFLRLIRYFLLETNNADRVLDCLTVCDILRDSNMKLAYINTCVSLLDHLFADQLKFCAADIESKELQYAHLSLV